jgi:hypothetical protein
VSTLLDDPNKKHMKQLFFSQPYIDATIEQIKDLLDNEIDTYLVTDSTYINDQCPSVQIVLVGTTYLLHLPNSFVSNVHQEQYNEYTLILDEDYGTGKDAVTFPNLESAVNYLVFEKYYA